MVPEKLPLLIELIGPAATLALTENFGGTRLYVSGDAAALGTLAAAIGPGAMRALAAHFPSTTIEVPTAYAFRARYHRDGGLNDAAIAMRLGITQAHVADLLA